MESLKFSNLTPVMLPSNKTVTVVLRLPIQFPDGVKAFIYVLIALLIFLIIVGNSLVMISFIVDKRLRTPSNFPLLNMAICDFFIGKSVHLHFSGN